jgi:hypothetical protein
MVRPVAFLVEEGIWSLDPITPLLGVSVKRDAPKHRAWLVT